MNFNNKNVLITGGTTGIGLATAKAFIQQGAHVMITGKNVDNLQNAAAEINDIKLKTVVSDTANLTDIDTLEKTIVQSGKKLDVLFLNAGVSKFATIESTSVADFDLQFNINVKGLFFTLQKMIPHLQDGASVVFTSSATSTASHSQLSVYSATKSAIDTIARVAATELAERNIRVNIISPGPIDTPILGKAMSADEAKATQDFYKTGGLIPLKKIGTPEEVAEAVLFLSATTSSFITGASLSIDGGTALRR
ncbi:SDR family oxidoreductase [Pedobacter antarcticus]|uniref:SDR family oxidoreductase n=1 Tax=Pedobacter antarcticus TaxID=34086 RepID=UPI00292EAAB8|nr:SDR family oxidoreductase [Pedobacter antarcticus]